jgi:ribosomal protein S18 acetylase RimI-like enzyme
MRPLRPADAEAFAALVRSAFADWAVDPLPSALRVTADDIGRHFGDGGGGVTTDPAQAGLLWAEKEGGLYISRVAVHPAHRRQGLAARLLSAAEAEARRRGLPRLWLSTRLAMASNRALFRRCGFVEGATHVHAGFTEPTYIDLSKSLGEPTGVPGVLITLLER